MRTMKRAITMLHRNKKESLSFIMTLTLSIGLLYLFVNLQSATATSNTINLSEGSTTDLIMLIFTCAIALICAFNCFLSNTYFQKAKAKELCIYLSIGMNIVALAKYLFIQNLILLLISTCLGGILGLILNPIINLFISQLISISIPIFNITFTGTLTWLAILLFEFIFMVMSTVGYAYRTELKDLLDDSHRMTLGDSRMIKLSEKAYIIFFILGLIFILIVPAVSSLCMLGCVFGIFGLQGILRYAIPQRIEGMKNIHRNLKPETIIISGGIYSILKNTGFYILMLFGTLLFMSCFLITLTIDPYIQSILCIGYLLILFMMSISIYYKLILEAKKQINEFYHLQLLGFLKKDLKKILLKQLTLFFTMIIIATLPYCLLICIKFIIAESVSIWLCSFIVCSYIIILMIFGWITRKSYCDIVLGSSKEEK